MRDAGVGDLLGDLLNGPSVRHLVVGDAEPVQPVAFVAAGPERRVARPQSPRLAGPLPIGHDIRDLGREIGGKRVALPVEHRPQLASSSCVDGREQGVEGLAEQRHAVFDEPCW